jgi:hypothetical protein
MPGISDCFDIGELGVCDGDAGNGAHGSFRLGANAFPGAGLGGIDIDREKHLAVGDRYRRQHIGIGQGDTARRRHLGQRIENLLLRYAHGASPIAFSSEVDTGSREENASNKEYRASVLIPSEPRL